MSSATNPLDVYKPASLVATEDGLLNGYHMPQGYSRKTRPTDRQLLVEGIVRRLSKRRGLNPETGKPYLRPDHPKYGRPEARRPEG